MRGKFIVFEGLDGSGKSSQLEILKEKMISQGRKVVTTCEPSDNAIGKFIRTALKGEIKLDPQTILMLFAADRIEHIKNFVIPQLEQGNDVLCDRFYLSNLAYQAEVVDMEQIITYNSHSMSVIRPDATFYCKLSAEECMRRINANRGSTELFENKQMLEKVGIHFLEAIELLKGEEKIVIVDASKAMDDISVHIWTEMSSIL